MFRFNILFVALVVASCATGPMATYETTNLVKGNHGPLSNGAVFAVAVKGDGDITTS